ncbi:MAG: hypothetical protein AABW64_02975 [Nanoarchaeota archaeon]
MFRKYGLLGILLIVLVELNFFFKIEPFASWYFPLVWMGYILVVDALVYKLRGNSLISNRFSQFLGMIVISALFWRVFEFLNIATNNWQYQGLDDLGRFAGMMGTISFATVLPAFFETVELIRTVHLFEHKTLHKKHKITKHFLHVVMGFGLVCFFLPLLLPKFAFPLVWLSFFLLLDPINYLHHQPSILGHIKRKDLTLPLTLLLAGIILGFFWEFWNYWAVPKWIYDVPFVGFFKIFEMPILGYLGYFPFAFELYAMYWFVRSLFVHKEHLLE